MQTRVFHAQGQRHGVGNADFESFMLRGSGMLCQRARACAQSSHRKGQEQLGLSVALAPDDFNLWALMASRCSNATRSIGCVLCPVVRS
eukprot:12852868-Alexandrium_andersonii.AAC.1